MEFLFLKRTLGKQILDRYLCYKRWNLHYGKIEITAGWGMAEAGDITKLDGHSSTLKENTIKAKVGK